MWELAEHRFLFIVERPEHAGHAMHAIFVEDLDALIEEISARGSSQPSARRTRTECAKATYRDADGNEIGFGGARI